MVSLVIYVCVMAIGLLARWEELVKVSVVESRTCVCR